jgi:hypothetical protein
MEKETKMPNWCMNSAVISGRKDKLDLIVRALKEDKLLEALCPLGDWEYNKAVELWGTKWDVHNASWELDEANNTLTINFDTAWGPPTAAYSYGEKLHNIEIEATFHEDGMMFIGEYKDGEGTSYSYDFEEECLKTEAPWELVEDWGIDYSWGCWKEDQDLP